MKNGQNEVIRVKKLSYKIHDKLILDKVSLLANQGKIVGLIGPNGSGKTTLIRHIYRSLPSLAKTIYIYGEEIENLSYCDSAKKMTVMKQENNSDFPYTVLEMVLMGRSPYKKLFEGDSYLDKEISINALKKVGMEDFVNQKYDTLSGGEKQRVLIARSLVQEVDILILDEPTNHLDVHYQWSLMEMIQGLGKTVFAIFHELNLAFTFCDYIYVLNKNSIAAKGSPKEICTKELLAEVFRVDAEIVYTKTGEPKIIFNGTIS